MPSSLRDPLVRLRRTLGDTTRHELLTLADQDWYLTVGTLALVIQVYVTLRLRAGLSATQRVGFGDSVISEFIGLPPASGGRLNNQMKVQTGQVFSGGDGSLRDMRQKLTHAVV
jgi:hypothetical protein